MNNCIDIYDTTVAVWEESVDEADFRSRVFIPAQRFLARRGWNITEDPYVKNHYKSISRDRRIASNGELRAGIETSGRRFHVEIWQDAHNITHPSGGKYEFGKRSKMPYLLGLRCDIEIRKLVGFLHGKLSYEIHDRRYRGETADESIRRHTLESGHYNEGLGHAEWHGNYNRRTADGKLLEHDTTVWFYSHNGRLQRGRAFYHLNNMWWVKISRYEFTNLASFELYAEMPTDVRKKHNPKLRRHRLEQKISAAVERMDFDRAKLLKHVLFGREPLYRIWNNETSLWWRTNSCGYTDQVTQAGLYWESEAARIVQGTATLLMKPVTPSAHEVRGAA